MVDLSDQDKLLCTFPPLFVSASTTSAPPSLGVAPLLGSGGQRGEESVKPRPVAAHRSPGPALQKTVNADVLHCISQGLEVLRCDVVDVAGIQCPAPPPDGAGAHVAILRQLHPGLVNKKMEAVDF